MDKLYQKLWMREYTAKENSLYYSLGMMLFSFSSIILLIIVTRFLGEYQSGIFSIGWSVCQQMLTIGLFGTRNVQVSDIEKRHGFSDFFTFKYLSIALMIISAFFYCKIIHLEGYELFIAILLTVLMSAESIADVCAGFFQLENKLAISGISYIIRVLGYDFIFMFVLVVSKSLPISIITAIIFSYLWLIIFDISIIKNKIRKIFYLNFTQIKKVFLLSVAICISAFLTNYIVNVPKNSIALYLDNSTQAYYNILAMPSFVISLFASVFLVPMYTNIAKLYNEDQSRFRKFVLKIVIYFITLTIVFVLLGELIGLSIMNVIFGLNLSAYRLEFAILLFSGGFSSLANFFIYILTVLAYSKVLYWVYGSVAIFATFFGNYLVKHYNLFGASITYFISTFAIALFLFIVIIFIMQRSEEDASII